MKTYDSLDRACQKLLTLRSQAPWRVGRLTRTVRPRTFDLRSIPDLTFDLLDEFSTWRERLVEEIVIEDGDHVTTTSSYQLRVPVELVTPYCNKVKNGDIVNLLLPLSTRPKGILFGVDLVGHSEFGCSLTPKRQIAWLEREYMRLCFEEQVISAGVESLLYAVANYSNDIWEHFVASTDSNAALRDYLNDGLPFGVTDDAIENWKRCLGNVEQMLLDALGEPLDQASATENMLRVLPFADELPGSSEEASRWLKEFAVAISTLDPPARGVVAEYGRRWEVIVETCVTVGSPCKVKLIEKRPWGSQAAKQTTQRIPIGDAAITHIEVRVADHSVELASEPVFRDVWKKRVGVPVVNSVRHTADTVAVYVSNDEAPPYFVDMTVTLRPRRAARILSRSILTMAGAAVGVVFLLPEDAQLADNLAFLIFPLTLAGAIILTRDGSAVARRLQERNRSCLVGLIVALWTAAVVRILASDVDVGWFGDQMGEALDALHGLAFW